MNIATYSPALTLLYVFVLLWILMGVDLKRFERKQRLTILAVAAFLCLVNQVLRELLASDLYGRTLLFVMHLPTFFLFLYVAKRGVIKTFFMILTATVFTAPAVVIGNLLRQTLLPDSSAAQLLSNLLSFALMLLLAQYVFRSSFNYLLVYGDKVFFLWFSLVPFLYYLYVLLSVNLDTSSLSHGSSFLVRYLPTLNVLLFYFLLPLFYRSLREKMLTQSAQAALQQKLTSTEDQIALLNEANTRMAIYRHDIRHQLNMLEGLLSNGKPEQAHEFVKAAMADLDAITPKRFCENQTIDLLCSSFDSKAQRLGVSLRVNAQLPKELSLSDTDLCSMVSNGLENALRAASQPDVTDKWVEFYCEIKQNKFLIQIQNPYAGTVTIENGLPVSKQEGHGYGCLSIQTIAQRYGGLFSFQAENGLFTLRLILPLQR